MIGKKLLFGLVLSSAFFVGGCKIDRAHFEYDQTANQLVSPLAQKELDDQQLELNAAFKDGKISEEEFKQKSESLAFKKKSIDLWGRVVEDNLKD